MSGLSPIGSSTASSTSGASTPSSTTSLLSQVGQSLLTTGQAPDAVKSTSTATTSPTSTLSSYQAEYLTLQQQDTAELLYASFLSPTAGLENADAVLGQAAALLGTPGSLSTSLSTGSTSSSASSTSSTGSGSTSGSGSTASSGSSGTSAAGATSSVSSLLGFPSVSSILAGSDNAANATLTAYGNAPAGSSIIDYQA